MDILEYISHHVGYIVNERFINIPAQIAPTTFKSLWSEIERAKTKAMEYNLSYYLLINKTCRLPKMGGGAEKGEMPTDGCCVHKHGGTIVS